jgi:class 3 adenylate cyclase/ketosteroid isomerase-like protein
MQPSEEIRRVIDRLTRAIAEGDNESVLARLSDDPNTLIIGSDPSEWWRGREARAIWRRQLEEFDGSFRVTANEIDAWEEGSVGWATVKETIDWGGTAIEGRASYILHLEHDEWKIVHVHWSFPQPHTDVLGRSLTVTMEELEQAVRREKPDLTGTLDSEGTVTIAFTDIVDSTVLLSRVGDRAWRDLLRRHNAVIEETTAGFGGTVVEVQGDGSMLAFPSARRGVACTHAIQHAMNLTFADAALPIRVRIGVHTGDALHDTDHFFGTTVHYAARVASQALGGEVLLSSVVHDLVAGSGIHLHESREVRLKGLEGLHRLYSLDLTTVTQEPSGT